MSDTQDATPTSNLSTFDMLKYILTYSIAVFILIAYVVFVRYLLKDIDTEDESWKRMMLIFSSVEAIVFAAVGFIFGKEVHKKIAQKAEANEDAAKKEAKASSKEKEKEREKGLTLAAMVIAQDSQGGRGVFGIQSGGDDSPKHVSPLVAKAKALYPEL